MLLKISSPNGYLIGILVSSVYFLFSATGYLISWYNCCRIGLCSEVNRLKKMSVSPLHVHVQDNTPLHVHVKKPKKGGITKQMLVSRLAIKFG